MLFCNCNLVKKVGHLPFNVKSFNLPKVGQPAFIEDASSNDILSVENENEVDLSKKIGKTNRNTRAKSSTNFENSKSDPQKWIIHPADSSGWFRISHPNTGLYLTSGKKSVKIEKLATAKELKANKHLVQVQKTFVWCPYLEEFVTYIAYQRNYEEQDLQVDLGGLWSF